jgi:hypothetical protein
LGLLWRHAIVTAFGLLLLFIFFYAAMKSSFSAPVADGEADCPVFSDEELDELVEVELDLPSSRGAL